jgi:hypothetical protein
MLDSLVRVSRRVGWNADRMAADREHSPADRTLTPPAVTAHWIQSAEFERATKRPAANERRFLGPAVSDATPSYNSPARRPEAPSRRACEHRGAGRGTAPGKVRQSTTVEAPSGPSDPRTTPRRASERLNPPGMPCGSTRLPLNGFTYS